MSSPSELPKDGKSWAIEARNLNLDLLNESIHTGLRTDSASSISIEQFLLLQVIWRRNLPIKDLYALDWLDAESFRLAKQYVSKSPDFGCFVKSLNNSAAAPSRRLGVYALVRHYNAGLEKTVRDRHYTALPKIDVDRPSSNTRAMQKQKSATAGFALPTQQGQPSYALPMRPRPRTPPSPTPGAQLTYGDDPFKESPSTPLMPQTPAVTSPPSLSVLRYSPMMLEESKEIPKVKDEEVVNAALLLLLNSFVIDFGNLQADWSPHRRAFKFSNAAGQTVYEARVDGYLQEVGGDMPCAIVEVKPFSRYEAARDKIKMQESAQMVAWIRDCPPPDWTTAADGAVFTFVPPIPSSSNASLANSRSALPIGAYSYPKTATKCTLRSPSLELTISSSCLKRRRMAVRGRFFPCATTGRLTCLSRTT